MYVKNGKISSRQTFRLYMFDLMGIATLLLPPYLTKTCGVSGIYAIIFGTCLGLIYLYYLGWVMKKMGMDVTTFLREKMSGWIRMVFLLLTMIHSIITAGFCAHVFANLMQYSLVRDSSYIVILLLIMGVAAYAVSGGIESRARVYEVLFWFILVPYIAMMLASTRNFEWAYLQPGIEFDVTNIGIGTYFVFLFFTPLFFTLFLIGEKEKNYGRNIIKTVTAAILCSGGILLGSYVLLVGNFGAESLMNLRYPVVTLMSTIQFEGNFLKRMDALMLAVWFFTLYALLNLHLHYGVRMLEELSVPKKEKLAWWQLFLPVIAAFLIAYGMHIDRGYIELFWKYYSYGAVPFMVIVPVFLILVVKYGGGKR